MAKAKKSVYFCQNCGHEESKWLGQCPMCKEWNTFVEEKVRIDKEGGKDSGREAGTGSNACRACQRTRMTRMQTETGRNWTGCWAEESCRDHWSWLAEIQESVNRHSAPAGVSETVLQ